MCGLDPAEVLIVEDDPGDALIAAVGRLARCGAVRYVCSYRLHGGMWLHWQIPLLTWGSIPGPEQASEGDRFGADRRFRSSLSGRGTAGVPRGSCPQPVSGRVR